MCKANIPLLWLFCLLVMAGCGFTSAVPTGGTASKPTAALSSTPAPLARCPRAPAAQPGQAPAAPLSLYVRNASGVDLEALNPGDGSVRWQETVDLARGWVTAVTVAQSIVYVVTSEGTVSALNASDGRLRWCGALASAAPPTNNPLWSHLATDRGTVYVAGNSGDPLVALNASDGALRWRSQPTKNDVTALLAAEGRAYVTPGTPSCGGVSALNASDGHEAWCFHTTYGLIGPPAVIDGVVYVSEAGPPEGAGFLDALGASDGSQRWRVGERQGSAGGLQPTGADGVVYVADSWGVAAFAASDGAERWQVQQPAAEIGPVAANGMVYVGTVAGTGQPAISALSTSTGRQQWQMPLTAGQQAAQISLQRRPAFSGTHGPVFNALSVVDALVVVSYISTSPTTTPSIAALNAGTGQRGWGAEGVLLAAG